MTTTLDRFLSKVEVSDTGCWLWQGKTNKKCGGYGYFRLGGKWRLAHRVSVELHVGPIPDEMEVDHLCFVTACVNPNHLDVVTPGENQRRARDAGRFHMQRKQVNANAAKTECKRGHPLSGSNLGWLRWRGRTVARKCKTCAAAASRRYRAKVRTRVTPEKSR